MIMRLRCRCGRALADAMVSELNRDYVWAIRDYIAAEDGADAAIGKSQARLELRERKGVEMTMYRHQETGRDVTYTLHCTKVSARGRPLARDKRLPTCGMSWQITAKRLALTWGRIRSRTNERVVIATLGDDL